MEVETDQESEYWTVLKSTQQRWYPGFVDQLSSQTKAKQEEGRAAVIEFRDGTRPSIQPLETSRALRRYLTRYPPCSSDIPVHRRVFLLEGLPKKFIEVLGSKLGVPPSFFAAHWAGPGRYIGNLLNRSLRHYDNRTRFMLTFPKMYGAKINELEGDKANPIYYMESSVNRQLSRITLFGDFDGPLSSFEKLSFWTSCETGELSWDAVLLVDPPLGEFVRWSCNAALRKVNHDNSDANPLNVTIEAALQDGSWYTPCTFATTLTPVTADWIHAEQAPDMQSLFDDILLLYPTTHRQSTKDPNICIDICRRLVLSAWTARLRVVEAEVTRKQYQMSVGTPTTGLSNLTWADKSWNFPWQERQFGGLVRAKSALESIDVDLYYSMDALGIGSDSQTTEEWEAGAWKSLRNAVQTLKKRVDIISQAYTEAVSVRQSIVSNQQAEQVGYLTSLAVLFVPASFVASIFSMGGDFSAGADRFWVFWAISVPLVLLSCIFLFTKLGERIWSSLRQYSEYGRKEEYPV